ncbi:MAG: DUF2784 domain-containing protein [Desulfobacterales bacterium]|nr:DUF2784 domain-containing protein [Desulfobacterales bacterium]MDJ0887691.1 DUF2784 domain-containing protein [Desulfobacterales bacterium]
MPARRRTAAGRSDGGAMICRFMADATLVVHLLFIVFAVVGAFAALRWRWLIWVHLPCALWAVAIEWGGWICPLTPLEVFFRRCASQAGFAGGFVQHYLLPVIYPPNLTRDIQIGLGVFVLGINLLAYALVVRRTGWKRRRPP